MSGHRLGKTRYHRNLRGSAGLGLSYSRSVLIARKRADGEAPTGRGGLLAALRDDVSRSGYFMTIIAIASLVAAILSNSGDGSPIVVVPVAETPYQPQNLPAEWQGQPGPKLTIVIS